MSDRRRSPRTQQPWITVTVECPFLAISRHPAARNRLPLCPQHRTFAPRLPRAPHSAISPWLALGEPPAPGRPWATPTGRGRCGCQVAPVDLEAESLTRGAGACGLQPEMLRRIRFREALDPRYDALSRKNIGFRRDHGIWRAGASIHPSDRAPVRLIR
jgi:hypothetical protein